MTYEDTLIRWAAKRWKIPGHQIEHVSLYHSKGSGGCDTCDYGGECEVHVGIKMKDGKYRSDDLDADLPTLLKEILGA